MPKVGGHRFCCDACRIAHNRAFRIWSKNRVTHGAISATPGSSGPGRKRNTKRGKRRVLPASDMACCRKVKRNTKKGKKRVKK